MLKRYGAKAARARARAASRGVVRVRRALLVLLINHWHSGLSHCPLPHSPGCIVYRGPSGYGQVCGIVAPSEHVDWRKRCVLYVSVNRVEVASVCSVVTARRADLTRFVLAVDRVERDCLAHHATSRPASHASITAPAMRTTAAGNLKRAPASGRRQIVTTWTLGLGSGGRHRAAKGQKRPVTTRYVWGCELTF
jgi:hypothetical protein